MGPDAQTMQDSDPRLLRHLRRRQRPHRSNGVIGTTRRTARLPKLHQLPSPMPTRSQRSPPLPDQTDEPCANAKGHPKREVNDWAASAMPRRLFACSQPTSRFSLHDVRWNSGQPLFGRSFASFGGEDAGRTGVPGFPPSQTPALPGSRRRPFSSVHRGGLVVAGPKGRRRATIQPVLEQALPPPAQLQVGPSSSSCS